MKNRQMLQNNIFITPSPAAGGGVNNPDEAFVKAGLSAQKTGEKSYLNNLFQKKSASNNISRFSERLEAILAPNLPAKELICLIVRSALEIEYGRSFTLSPSFDKMVEKIANSMMINPVLRRQTLSIVSMFVESKMPCLTAGREIGKKN